MFPEFCFAFLLGMHVVLLAHCWAKLLSIREISPLIVAKAKPKPTRAELPIPVTGIVTEVMANITDPSVKEALKKNGILYRLVIDFIHENKKIVRPYGLARFIETDIISFTCDQTPLFDLDIFQLTVGPAFIRNKLVILAGDESLRNTD